MAAALQIGSAEVVSGVMPDWHHSPIHRLGEGGAYSVTGATYYKQLLFHRRSQLDMLQEMFFDAAKRYAWSLHSWSFFPNHYHFVGFTEKPATSLPSMINEFHSGSSRELNRIDGTPGRKVWLQYWDTHLTKPGSYLARLKYVQENPVHHGVVRDARKYKWCSAEWFERNAHAPFLNAVRNVKIDRVTMIDDF